MYELSARVESWNTHIVDVLGSDTESKNLEEEEQREHSTVYHGLMGMWREESVRVSTSPLLTRIIVGFAFYCLIIRPKTDSQMMESDFLGILGEMQCRRRNHERVRFVLSDEDCDL